MTTREKTGPTPNGGVRSEANFRDKDGNPVDESVAVQVEIIEYDANDQEIARTYGTIDRTPKG